MIKAFGSISLAEFLDFSQNSFKVDQQQIYTLPFLEKHWINDIELKNHHQFPNSHINLVLSKKKIKSPQKITEFIHRSDFIVIGSGIAGLSAALELSKHGKVLIITKGKLRDANTEYAQGGIAAVISPKDDFPAHIADTHLVGAGLTDTEAVKILVEEGSARVKELIKMGVPFDRDEDGQISLAQEGGHSFPRILHAGGDATGREIERFLSQKVIQNKKITIFTGVFVTDLLVKNKTAYGVKAVVQESGQEIDFLAGATLIATGGFSQIYLMSTNPLSATGDLIACCYRVGGQVEDMEFVQFHPTTLVIPPEKRIANPLIAYLPQNFLISEAVRGAGGILKNIKGESFMKKYDPRGELASRDIVSRAIFSEMAKTKAEFVYLDVAHIHDELTKTPIKFKERFPTIYARCLEIGLDLDQENLIPVAPAAHYTMGGIKINVNGQTNIKGLYAAGEVSRVGVHGANRLASNSLLEGLVFGERAGKSMAKYIKSTKKILNKKDFNLSPSKKIFATTKEVASEMDDLKTFDQKIKTLMTKYVGIIRHAEGLNIALKELTKIEKQLLHSQFPTKYWIKDYPK
jgi:L-aspartate oxidase